MRPARPAAFLLCAAALAGCGSSSPGDATADRPASKPSVTGGSLRVGATDLGLGDAVVGSSGGVQVLPNGKVPPSERDRDGVGAGANCADTDLVPADENIRRVVDATLCLLNGERADAGLGPLKVDGELSSAARAHSEDMIRAQYFDHVAPDGSTPVDRIRRTGYIPNIGRWLVGENLAWGTGALSTPKSIVKAWMNSQGHRANILRADYTDIGFGVYAGNPRRGDGEGATYTTTFGSRTGTTTASAGGTRSSGAKRARRKQARRVRASKVRKARASKARRTVKARTALQRRR